MSCKLGPIPGDGPRCPKTLCYPAGGMQGAPPPARSRPHPSVGLPPLCSAQHLSGERVLYFDFLPSEPRACSLLGPSWQHMEPWKIFICCQHMGPWNIFVLFRRRVGPLLLGPEVESRVCPPSAPFDGSVASTPMVTCKGLLFCRVCSLSTPIHR